MARRRPSRPPSPPSPSRSRSTPKRKRSRGSAWGKRNWITLGMAGAVVILAVWFVATGREDVRRLRKRAEVATEKKDWNQALALWRRVNATPEATGATWLEEGKACLALGKAAQAEQALRKATEASPGTVRGWALLLEILRVEDRQLDAMNLGWRAYEQVSPEDHAAILREITLTALTDLPDELARTTLKRWITADPSDVEAETALLRRIGADPRSDDPDREARVERLSALTTAHPDRPNPREALAGMLADGGEADQGRAVLTAWPVDARDARYDRLRGRWALEYDRQPEEAVEAFRSALKTLPHDWRTHYRLARALTNLGRREEAEAEARTVARIREALDPLRLGPSLETAFSHLDQASARATVADLCARVGLIRLAQAWRSAASPDSGTTRPMP